MQSCDTQLSEWLASSKRICSRRFSVYLIHFPFQFYFKTSKISMTTHCSMSVFLLIWRHWKLKNWRSDGNRIRHLVHVTHRHRCLWKDQLSQPHIRRLLDLLHIQMGLEVALGDLLKQPPKQLHPQRHNIHIPIMNRASNWLVKQGRRQDLGYAQQKFLKKLACFVKKIFSSKIFKILKKNSDHKGGTFAFFFSNSYGLGRARLLRTPWRRPL